MKTVSLTPWCNLFLTESKYSISLTRSHNKALLYAGSATFILLISVVLFTYAYHLALAGAFVTVLLLSGFKQVNVNKKPCISMFELTSQGLCCFDQQHIYQIQASSRFSFLGCWLVLQLISNNQLHTNSKKNKAKKVLFIFRDSLSAQDFSRITRVIAQMTYPH